MSATVGSVGAGFLWAVFGIEVSAMTGADHHSFIHRCDGGRISVGQPLPELLQSMFGVLGYG